MNACRRTPSVCLFCIEYISVWYVVAYIVWSSCLRQLCATIQDRHTPKPKQQTYCLDTVTLAHRRWVKNYIWDHTTNVNISSLLGDSPSQGQTWAVKENLIFSQPQLMNSCIGDCGFKITLSTTVLSHCPLSCCGLFTHPLCCCCYLHKEVISSLVTPSGHFRHWQQTTEDYYSTGSCTFVLESNISGCIYLQHCLISHLLPRLTLHGNQWQQDCEAHPPSQL